MIGVLLARSFIPTCIPQGFLARLWGSVFGEEYSSFWLVERAGLLQVSTIRYVPVALVLAD